MTTEDSTTIGTYELKTHLAAIIDAVEGGKEYVITRHGKRVARLAPEPRDKMVNIDDLIRRWEKLQSRCVLGEDMDWRDLRDAGRKW